MSFDGRRHRRQTLWRRGSPLRLRGRFRRTKRDSADLTPFTRSLLHGIDEDASHSSRVVVLIAGEASEEEIAFHLRGFRDDVVHVLVPSVSKSQASLDPNARRHVVSGLSATSQFLTTLGPVRAIVKLRMDSGDLEWRYWRRLFLHLTSGGWYAVRRSPEGGDGLVALATRLESLKRKAAGETHADRRISRADRQFAEAVGHVISDAGGLLITKKGYHHLRLNHDNVLDILPLRNPQVSVEEVESLRPGTFTSRATVFSHGEAEPNPPLISEIDYPAMRLKRYSGRIAFMRNALVYTDGEILPESFRHHLSPGAHNVRAINLTPEFSRISPRYRPKEVLEGSYYHLDSENPGHFGHIMGEDVSRLWGWWHAKERDPDLKLLFRTRAPSEKEAPAGGDPKLERAIFGAFGLSDGDIAWVDHPVYVDSLCGATPMLHDKGPHYIHPAITDVWDTLAANLVDREFRAPRRVFVSRRPSYRRGNRRCRNAEQVEAFFAERGFTIVYPELLARGEQVALFSGASVIAGFAGSAMYSLMFASHHPAVIILSHDAYTARTEHLITSVRGGVVHYFWSSSDVAHPTDGWSQRAYYSSWMFDFLQHSKTLDSVIRDLE